MNTQHNFILILVIFLAIIYIGIFLSDKLNSKIYNKETFGEMTYSSESNSETNLKSIVSISLTIGFLSLLVICLCCSSCCYLCSPSTPQSIGTSSSNLESTGTKYFILAQPLQPIQFEQPYQ